MTTQRSDEVIYEGKKYDLAGIGGDLYFDPEGYGVMRVLTGVITMLGTYGD